MPPIDLRSDTVTRPSAAMRQAIANAEVGDDVIDVDPTCQRLERLTSEILGKEAAVFMPSGSMTNQVGVRIHCKPGDEFLCEAGALLERRELRDVAKRYMAEVVQQAAATGDYRWNCGERQFNLGLFRGMAGVGYSALRLVDPSLPNVLIFG